MKQTLHELDTVVLTRDLPDAGLRVGDLGAIVHVRTPDTFEVEFVAASGETVAVRTLSTKDVRMASDDDVLATRPTDDD